MSVISVNLSAAQKCLGAASNHIAVLCGRGLSDQPIVSLISVREKPFSQMSFQEQRWPCYTQITRLCMRIFQRLKNMLLYKKHGWLTTNAKDFESAGKMMQEWQRVFIKLPDITSSREKTLMLLDRLSSHRRQEVSESSHNLIIWAITNTLRPFVIINKLL